MFKPLNNLAVAVSLLKAITVAFVVASSFAGDLDEQRLQHEGLATLVGLIGVFVALIASVIASVVVFLVFVHRAARNARALSPNDAFDYTPGWAVGWWFVPFANLVKPFRAFTEIWQKSDSTPLDGQTPPLVSAWWAAFVVSSVVDRVAAKTDGGPIVGVSCVLDVVATVLCILVVRRLTALQNERHALLVARTPHVSASTPFAT